MTSEVDGKATNWRAYHQDGRWVEDVGKPAAKKAAVKKTAAKKPTAKKPTAKKAAVKKAPAKKAK